jgi:hypothetical protein
MSQHDLDIANQGFPATRADLNLALKALGSLQSGATAPSTTYANMLWYDTANNILKIRNEDNDAFISLFTLDQTADNIEALTINGTITADALTVDTNTLHVDAANNRVGIGTASPSQQLSIESSGSARMEVISGTTGTSIIDMGDSADADIGGIRYSHSDNSLQFRANNDVRGRFISSGGLTFGSDTAAANALDDYEEGTWDPQVGGSATYTSQAGIYTKIGNVVTVHFDIEIAVLGTGTNNRITNFPFTSNSSTGVPLFAGCVSFFSGINSSNTFIGMYVINGTTECNFTGGTGNATTISQNGFAIFGNNARVIGSVTYRTT